MDIRYSNIKRPSENFPDGYSIYQTVVIGDILKEIKVQVNKSKCYSYWKKLNLHNNSQKFNFGKVDHRYNK